MGHFSKLAAAVLAAYTIYAGISDAQSRELPFKPTCASLQSYFNAKKMRADYPPYPPLLFHGFENEALIGYEGFLEDRESQLNCAGGNVIIQYPSGDEDCRDITIQYFPSPPEWFKKHESWLFSTSSNCI